MKKFLSAILSGVLLMALISACGAAAPQPPADGNPRGPEGLTGRGIRVASQNEPATIAPAMHGAVVSTHKNLMTHNALFRIDYYTLAPVPDLVSHWRALSDTVFEFTVHEGILFHNGEELTAYDIEASWRFVRQFAFSAAHESIVDFYVADRYTISVDTGGPNAMLFFDLAHQSNMIAPRSLLEAGHDFNAAPIGSGPFEFREWRAGNYLHFEAFENYFDTERAARVEHVTWLIIPEGSSRTIALEAGEVDYIIEVAAGDVERLDNNPNISVIAIPSLIHQHLLLNNDRPQFNSIHARRAIGMAINKETVVLAAFGEWAIPTRSQAPAVFSGVTDEGTYSFDPDGARALLLEHNIDPASLAFNIIVSNEERNIMAEVIAVYLEDIGIPVTITRRDLATTLSMTTTGDYEAAFAGFTSASLLGFMRGLFHNDFIDQTNRSRIRNQEISALIDRAVITVDPDAREAILNEAVIMANEFTGQIPIYMGTIVSAFNANLIVPEITATGFLNLNMMEWTE